MKLAVIVHEAKEGGYWAEVPALPGCITEGDTSEELMQNVRDAVEGWLAVEFEDRAAQAVNTISPGVERTLELAIS